MALSSRAHVVALPPWFLAFRILQILVATTLLGLAGYSITFLVLDGYCLALFTAIFTLIIVGYILLASNACPKAYNYWAILALDILGVVFWISTTGLLAAWASGLLTSSYTDSSSYDCSYDYYYCYKKRSLDPLLQKRYAVTTVDTWFNVLCASAGIAGLGFILFVVTLVTFSIYLHRHRKSGAPATVGGTTAGHGHAPTTMAPASVYNGNGVEAEKIPVQTSYA